MEQNHFPCKAWEAEVKHDFDTRHWQTSRMGYRSYKRRSSKFLSFLLRKFISKLPTLINISFIYKT